jgi:hypothetical protein
MSVPMQQNNPLEISVEDTPTKVNPPQRISSPKQREDIPIISMEEEV